MTDGLMDGRDLVQLSGQRKENGDGDDFSVFVFFLF
jgi:hypothetical protein